MSSKIQFLDEPTGAAPSQASGIQFLDEPAPAGGGIRFLDEPAPGGIQFLDEDDVSGLNPDPMHELPIASHAMDAFGGDFLRDLPRVLGVTTPGGKAIALDRAGREQGTPLTSLLPPSASEWLPESVRDAARMVEVPVQFGANVAAGFAGFAGAKLGFEIAKVAAAGREVAAPLGNLALMAKHGILFGDEDAVRAKYNTFGQEGGYSAEAAINKAMLDGKLGMAAHLGRMGGRAKEGAKAMVWGWSPALVQAVAAPPGERVDAFLDGLYTYPVESTVGMFLGLKAAGKLPIRAKKVQVKVGGELMTDHGGAPIYHKAGGVLGKQKDLEVNRLGKMLWDTTPDFLKTAMWGTMSPAQRLHVTQQEFNANNPSAALKRSRDALIAIEDAGGYEKLYQDVVNNAGQPLTDAEARAITIQLYDGSLRWKKGEGGKRTLVTEGGERVPREAVSVIPGDEAAIARDGLAKDLTELGVSERDLPFVLAALDKTVPHAMAEMLPEFAAETVRVGGRGDAIRRRQSADAIQRHMEDVDVVVQVPVALLTDPKKVDVVRSLHTKRGMGIRGAKSEVASEFFAGNTTKTKEEFAALAGSVKAEGVKKPLSIGVNEDGTLIVDGTHRALAAKKAGLATVPVKFKPNSIDSGTATGFLVKHGIDVPGLDTEELSIANVGYKEAHAARATAGRKGKIRKALADGDVPEQALKAHEFSMRRGRKEAEPQPLVSGPADLYNMMRDGIKAGNSTALLYGYNRLAKKMRSDVRWIAWMNQSDGPEMSGIKYVPHNMDNPLAKRAVAAVEALKGTEAGFAMPLTQSGALLNTSPFKLFMANAKRMKASKEWDAQLMAAILQGPEVRFISSDKAPPLARWLSEEMADPNSVSHQHRKLIRAQQLELLDVHGMSPMTVLDHYDAYLSRQWTDAAEMSVKLKQELDLDIRGGPMKGTGARHKRQLTEGESSKRLVEFMANDVDGTTPAEIIKFSVDNTQTLIEKVRFFNQYKALLEKNNIISDTQRPGYTRIMGSKDATPGGIGDPYNFMFGALADKWVPTSVARQMRGIKEMYSRAPALLTYWKLIRTVYNPMGYHFRNELGDLGNIAAVTGWMPYSKQWRRQMHEVNKEMAALDKGVRSRDAATIEVGGLSDQMLFDDAANSPLARAGDRYASARFKDMDLTPEGIFDRIKEMKSLLITGDWTKSAGKKAAKLRKAWDESRARAVEEYQAHIDEKGSALGGKLAMTTSRLRDLNKYLGTTALARWTMKQEYRRRLFAYKMAKHEMKMSDAEAVQWAKNTLHDYGDKPAWLNQAQTNPYGAMIIPPFATYGIKQGFHAIRATMNNPELFFTGSMVRAMNAHDFADMLPEQEGSRLHPGERDEADKAFASMWQFAHTSSFGASRKYLGTGKDLAEAMQYVGFNGNLVRAMQGYDKQGRVHGLTMTLPLRDISNLNTLLNDLQPGEDTDRYLAKISPAINFAMTTLNPDVFDPGTGMGANPTNRTWSEWAQRMTQYLGAVFTPVPGWYSQVDRVYKAAASASSGELETVGARRIPVHPVEAVSRVFFPGMSMSAIDQMDMMRRVKMKFTYKFKERSSASRRWINQQNPNFDDQRLVARLSDAWIDQYNRMVQLQMAYSLSPWSEAKLKASMAKLNAAWRSNRKRILAHEAVKVQDLGTPESNALGWSLLQSVEEVFNGND